MNFISITIGCGVAWGYSDSNGIGFQVEHSYDDCDTSQTEYGEGSVAGPWESMIPSSLLDLAVSAGVIDRQMLESTRVLR